MRRFAAFALALGIGALCAGAPPASAQAGATDPDAAAIAQDADAEIEAWVKQLEDGRMRLRDARERVHRLEDAKGRGAARRYPRGDAKAAYIADLEAAHAELDDARRALPDLVEEARRAGVPAGVLSGYEDEIEAEPDLAADVSDDS